jgi:AcrR family transcriptional regulator
MAVEPTTRTLRDEQKAFTRKRLVDAAVEVFRRTSYNQATIEDITTAAGASRATFYLHFKSKAEIVKVLLDEELLPDSNALYERLYALREPTRADVRAFVRELIEYWDRHEPAIDILQQAHAADREEIGEGWAHALLDTSSVLARYLTEVRGVDPQVALIRAVISIGLLDRQHFFERLPGVDLDREATIDALTDLYVVMFEPEPPR